jgi:hypothetical protein
VRQRRLVRLKRAVAKKLDRWRVIGNKTTQAKTLNTGTLFSITTLFDQNSFEKKKR